MANFNINNLSDRAKGALFNQLQKIAEGETIETSEIVDGAVTAGKIASDAVTTVKILDANVTAGKLASDAVTTVKILDANVTAGKLASDAVTTVKILDGNVTVGKIASDAVTTVKILDANVTAAKLAATLDLASHALTSLSVENGVPVNAVASTGTLTLTGVITPGSHAETILTSDTTNVANTETVTINSTVYRFMDTLVQAYDVQVGGSAAISLDNLEAAINASGTPGTEYFAGTDAHPTVVATTNTDTTQKIVVRIPGTASNAEATTETSAHLSWADTTIGGGTGDSNPGVAVETATIDERTYSFVDVLSETNGAAAITEQVLFGANSAAALDNLKVAINNGATEGTNYSTGTAVHATVTATTNSDTEQIVAAKTKGTVGDTLATTSVIVNGAWGAATLGSGVDGTIGIANEILCDATYLYHAIAANTIADTNWRRISLGSAY